MRTYIGEATSSDRSPGIQRFCMNIRFLRQRFGLSQRQAARRLHITVEILRSLEAGQIPPKVSSRVLFRAQKAYHVLLTVLLRIDLAED